MTAVCAQTCHAETAVNQRAADVDSLVKAALAAGGTTYKDPRDYGFMYGHGFQDLDGHVWELMWTDAEAAPPQA